MKTRTFAFAVVLLFVLSAAFAGERRSLMGTVRQYVGLGVKAANREFATWMKSARGGIQDLGRGAAKASDSIIAGGRSGMESLSSNASRYSAEAFRATRAAFTTVAREIEPVGTEAVVVRTSVAARRIVSPILEPAFLRSNDIVVAWDLATNGRPMRRSLVLDDRLLLEDANDDLFSFQPRNGIVQWIYPLTGPSQSHYVPEKTSLFVVARDTLIDLDREVGRPKGRFVLSASVSSPVSFTGKVVVFGSWDRRVYAFDRETRVRQWSFLPNDVCEAGVALAPNVAFVADDSGRLTAYDPFDHRIQWVYEAKDAIKVEPILMEGELIFPSEDLYIHSVNRFGGLSTWKFPIRGQVRQQPWVTESRIYFSADDDAFYCLSRDKGRLIWRVPLGGWPVAVGARNLYIEGPDQQVWAIDHETGEKVWTVSAKPFAYLVRNTESDHIYLSSDRGEIYALYLRGDHVEKKAAPEKPVPPKPGPKPPQVEPEPEAAPPVTAPPAVAPALAPVPAPAPAPAPGKLKRLTGEEQEE